MNMGCVWTAMRRSRPLPHVLHMDTFLKAYYLTEEDTERWIREHYKVRDLLVFVCMCVCVGVWGDGGDLTKEAGAAFAQEFTSKQLVSIIGTGVGVRMSKKGRQSAMTLIEELEKQRR
jgi:hypothetical protein